MSKKHERSSSQDANLKHPSTKRAKEIDQHAPYKELLDLRESHKGTSGATRNVLHWFRSKDLRAEDNRALQSASQEDGCLITCFLFSPKDLEWHGTSPARVDFMLESLRLLQAQLKKMDIPLVVLTAEERADKVSTLLDFVKKHVISHIFANIEYEVDELRRDIDLLKHIEADDELDVSFKLFHDQTVVEPGTLVGGAGTPMKVFTPYHKAWLAEVAENPYLLETAELPAENDKGAMSDDLKKLLDSPIPSAPESKRFASNSDRDRIRRLWPAGHEAAIKRLSDFLETKVSDYGATRSNPAADSSSRLSPYFAAGVLSVREALSAAKDANDGNNDFDGGDSGIASWARELVFREFYRHTLVGSPHDAMNLPHNLKFDFVQWEDDEAGWEKWCEGRTGVPFVDAGMRQLRAEAWMHNRLRMNVASYLRTNLLIDYRKGERFFAENLVDWDLSNNTQGWEPSYTVFNPVSQAERNDPHGDYIRRWVPELREVKGKAVFDPYHRLKGEEFEKLGYPEPHVDFKESKDRCIQRYKQDMADADP